MLDLRGTLGRRFGGIGAGLPTPALRLEAVRSRTLIGHGASSERALEFAARYLERRGIRGGATLRVHEAIPEHAGLGSGTQLALAVARALAELYEQPSDVRMLARDVGRARRSAIGTWLFAGGGLIVEGGRRQGSDAPAPLIARLPLPYSWRCVLAVPPGRPGVSGAREMAAFATLPPPDEQEVERVAHLALMALLPAVMEKDLATFGAALTEIQRINGRWFAAAQGGPFAPGASAMLIERMTAWGVPGVGQSSWGPAVYGIVGSASDAESLAGRLRDTLGPRSQIVISPFTNVGARVRRLQPQRRMSASRRGA